MNPYDKAQVLSREEKRETDFRLIVTLHKGADNAISKKDLAMRIFGKYSSSEDRALRLIQENLLNKGYVFCTNQDAGGYYEPLTVDEGLEYINRVIQSRIDSLIEKRNNAYGALKDTFPKSDIAPMGQPGLF